MPDVKPLGNFFTLQCIDVMKIHCAGLPSRSSIDIPKKPDFATSFAKAMEVRKASRPIKSLTCSQRATDGKP
jgi:hypothetical protein